MTSGTTYNNRSNQITKKYYDMVKGDTHPGFYKVLRKNGTHKYYTYHIRRF